MDGMAGREVAGLKLLKDLILWAQAIDSGKLGRWAGNRQRVGTGQGKSTSLVARGWRQRTGQRVGGWLGKGTRLVAGGWARQRSVWARLGKGAGLVAGGWQDLAGSRAVWGARQSCF